MSFLCNSNTPSDCFFSSHTSLLHLTSPQVWVDRSGEVSSQHATGTAASQGHCARSRLDPGSGSVSCSTGKMCSDKIALAISFPESSCPGLFPLIFIMYFQSTIFGTEVNHSTLGTNPHWPVWVSNRNDDLEFSVVFLRYMSTFLVMHILKWGCEDNCMITILGSGDAHHQVELIIVLTAIYSFIKFLLVKITGVHIVALHPVSRPQVNQMCFQLAHLTQHALISCLQQAHNSDASHSCNWDLKLLFTLQSYFFPTVHT